MGACFKAVAVCVECNMVLFNKLQKRTDKSLALPGAENCGKSFLSLFSVLSVDRNFNNFNKLAQSPKVKFVFCVLA